MSKRNYTPSIAKQQALTKRQQLNLRTETARYAGMTAKRLALFAAGVKQVGDGYEPLGEDDPGMSMAEIRAAEIILRKTMPDLQSVQLVDEDETANLTRDELENRLKGMIEQNPELAIVAGIIPRNIEGKVLHNDTGEEESVENHGDISSDKT